MDMHLQRVDLLPRVTLGTLFVRGVAEYFTQEAHARPDGKYLAGESAVPAGRYNGSLSYCRRFGMQLPVFMHTRLPVGFRIHPGHHVEDCIGTVVVGMIRDERRVGRTKVAYGALLQQILRATIEREAVELEIY